MMLLSPIQLIIRQNLGSAGAALVLVALTTFLSVSLDLERHSAKALISVAVEELHLI
ncbi:hypothetical protein Q8A64_04415 [Oxalobacteraceae bacterium R-40]|uniref:Uncharacterized protein n=1 Tax=Keguizhuia sedimenti TaxID=3064264 RepID=A0ABU1BKY4_9BURK|nr:hypothetical protein [Oxalobacteraceae bacterium R-40]